MGERAGGHQHRGEPDAGEGGRIAVAPGVSVSEGVLRWAFSRSSGPGGQNVNKVSTKAELRIDVEALPMSRRAIGRLRGLAAGKIIGERVEVDAEGVPRTVGGEIVLVSQSERSQSGNKSECLDKLRELLVKAQAEPKIRRKTKPSRSSVQRRLDDKQKRSQLKSNRGARHD